MKVMLVPSSVSEGVVGQNQFLTSYLINETVAIDAGCLGLEIEDVPKHAAFPEKAAVKPRFMPSRFEFGNHAEREAGTGPDVLMATDQLGRVA